MKVYKCRQIKHSVGAAWISCISWPWLEEINSSRDVGLINISSKYLQIVMMVEASRTSNILRQQPGRSCGLGCLSVIMW